MKSLYLLIVATFLGATAQAADFPEVYCVSTRSFESINQINLFTNKKGTMRINLQFYATDGQNEGNFDTANLQTIVRLNYDSSTGLMSNGADRVQFQLNRNSISAAEAERAIESNRTARSFDLMNLPGHKIEFKKYYLGKMVEYNLPGRQGYWTADLMKAFRAGVTDYVCGKVEDIKGRRPSIFDDLDR